jgi:hypothetical protein
MADTERKWKTSTSAGGSICVRDIYRCSEEVAIICSSGEINKAEALANAQLIAAAPLLFEACEAWQKIESEMQDNTPVPDLALRAQNRKQAVELTKQAIAAAKGK